ncbi:hypothetical protein QAD02_014882 [Eretmocerus hayati]|uniref:Uncharacterized protein n=1 Tax=Eretmocerus hayati TaxID=131215 RepID=A0ACC2PBG9_9HYME|nr:hypothetical protein QAD02_014882 [Eretmocerus hayati]
MDHPTLALLPRRKFHAIPHTHPSYRWTIYDIETRADIGKLNRTIIQPIGAGSNLVFVAILKGRALRETIYAKCITAREPFRYIDQDPVRLIRITARTKIISGFSLEDDPDTIYNQTTYVERGTFIELRYLQPDEKPFPATR